MPSVTASPRYVTPVDPADPDVITPARCYDTDDDSLVWSMFPPALVLDRYRLAYRS